MIYTAENLINEVEVVFFAYNVWSEAMDKMSFTYYKHYKYKFNFHVHATCVCVLFCYL